MGVLVVPSSEALGGIFQVSTAAGAPAILAASVEKPSGVRAALASLRLVKPLWAQGSAQVTGVLTRNDGSVVPLQGTVSGTSLALSGDSYTISATTASSGTLSGSATVPGGLTGSVSQPPVPAVTTPPPSDPTGTYKGTFQINTTLSHRNTSPTGQVVAACSVPLRITGSLTLHLSRLSDGTLNSHIDINWNDASLSSGTCPPAYSFAETDYYGIDFLGTAQSLVAARADRSGGPGGNGSLTKAASFIGAVSGTTVVGQVMFSYNYTVPVTGATHVEWYPTAAASVTLSKQ